MFNTIWNFISNVIFPIAVIIIACFLIFKYAKFILNKTKVNQNVASENIKKTVKPRKAYSFLNKHMIGFLEALKKALPDGYSIYPMVGCAALFDKFVRADLNLADDICDFVVFDKNYQVRLVVDMVEISIAETKQVTGHLSDKAIKYLKEVEIPILTYKFAEHYNIDELRYAIAKTVNPLLNA